ncbi:hypothetical protein PQH03_14010 [Ralstonia insidiosa]|jgi:hypothetical protein|uniref:hypothetical protein n=2 Tax=Burkholderiaceae TaxID=119060 RepID=UPI0006648836|nr:hypothetical protein [Ralstonia insidiosa]KMW45046.1 hypothetical protein AC240_22585 [Ralstonia sp. MD27]MBX3774127.1 hypothetical protein [Ralstonia pickettii]NOZ15045.1 hypothetical protein [Betaproteobacteria bacterium]MBA9857962.1 hypothetical protein [Ralstonia insidiosa]MBA9871698.1 hypothetical protein [Ralstonia insidiosa]
MWTLSHMTPLPRLIAGAALLALVGCAQLQTQTKATPNARTAPAGEVMSFTIPPDALGAHDPQLTAVLTKAGALAAAQKRPATIQVAALTQDFRYLNQALWNGVPAQRASYVHLENLTVNASQPYSVTIRTQD